MRVAIVGLVHGQVQGFLPALAKSRDAQLVAVVEPDTALARRYAERYHLPHQGVLRWALTSEGGRRES